MSEYEQFCCGLDVHNDLNSRQKAEVLMEMNSSLRDEVSDTCSSPPKQRIKGEVAFDCYLLAALPVRFNAQPPLATMTYPITHLMSSIPCTIANMGRIGILVKCASIKARGTLNTQR